MTELNQEARELLESGLAGDGPSAERRARVKRQLVTALGVGTVALSGAGSAAAVPVVGSGVAGGVVVAAKGLGVSSLLVWFGVGIAAGVGVSGAVALGARVAEPARGGALVHESGSAARASSSGRPVMRADVPALADGRASAEPVVASPGEVRASAAPVALRAEAPASGGVNAVAPPPVSVPSAGVSAAPSAGGSSLASANAPSSLSEEAALLQRAQRALAVNAPTAALAVLAEHERRFATGALKEERNAAKILALCALNRTAEARSLARAFVRAAPGSVLIPRLEHSCAAPLR